MNDSEASGSESSGDAEFTKSELKALQQEEKRARREAKVLEKEAEKKAKKKEEKKVKISAPEKDEEEDAVLDGNDSSSEEEELDQEQNPNLQCRYYENEFPEDGSYVVVRIHRWHENGAYVQLLEYDNIEGLILSGEVTRKRVNHVNKLLKIGKRETMVVVRVDESKSYIDLSRKKVQEKDQKACEKFYKKSKIVHNILRQVAVKKEVTLLSLYKAFGWKLYKQYEHAYDAFRLSLSDQTLAFKDVKVPEDVKEELLEAIKHRMAPQPVKVKSDFELKCMNFEGVEGIRYALLKTQEIINVDEPQVSFTLIAPPNYRLECHTVEKNRAIEKQQKALGLIKEFIEEKGGNFRLYCEPKVFGAKDDRDIEDVIAEAQQQHPSDEGSAIEDQDEGLGGGSDIENDDDVVE